MKIPTVPKGLSLTGKAYLTPFIITLILVRYLKKNKAKPAPHNHIAVKVVDARVIRHRNRVVLNWIPKTG